MGRRIICDDSGSLVNFLNALDDNHFVPSFKFIKYAAYLERFIFAKHRRFFFFNKFDGVVILRGVFNSCL